MDYGLISNKRTSLTISWIPRGMGKIMVECGMEGYKLWNVEEQGKISYHTQKGAIVVTLNASKHEYYWLKVYSPLPM
jgi:hypothetical protein